MKTKYILVVNLRRLAKEAYISLSAIKAKGYSVLLISKEFPSYCNQIVDLFFPIDTSNYELTINRVRTLANSYCIAGVVAFTETAVEVCSYIANDLDLPGNPIEAVVYSRNKHAMRLKLVNTKVPQVPYAHIKSINELNRAIGVVGYPAIIKPVNSSGSTGIFHINSDQDIKNFERHFMNIGNPTYDPFSQTATLEFIVEKYIEGEEVSVEGFIFNGEVIICGITDKLTTPDYKIEYQHIFPSKLSESEQESIRRDVISIVKCLGFDNCSFHLEGKWHQNKFYIIEVATRPGGGYITSHLVKNATNQNYYEKLVDIAVGKNPGHCFEPSSYSGIRFITAHREGVLSSVDKWDLVSSHPLVNSLFLEVNIGSTLLLPPRDYRLIRLYAFIVSASTHSEVSSALSDLANLTKPIIKDRSI